MIILDLFLFLLYGALIFSGAAICFDMFKQV